VPIEPASRLQTRILRMVPSGAGSTSARYHGAQVRLKPDVEYQDSSYAPALAKYPSRRAMGLTPPRL
jgi:hypothetical protein